MTCPIAWVCFMLMFLLRQAFETGHFYCTCHCWTVELSIDLPVGEVTVCPWPSQKRLLTNQVHYVCCRWTNGPAINNWAVAQGQSPQFRSKRQRWSSNCQIRACARTGCIRTCNGAYPLWLQSKRLLTKVPKGHCISLSTPPDLAMWKVHISRERNQCLVNYALITLSSTIYVCQRQKCY